MYFREMYGEDFIRMDEDVVNAGLNYGYSIEELLQLKIFDLRVKV